MQVVDAEGAEVASWIYTGNPHTGVDITVDQYHVNWATDADLAGVYTVSVLLGGTMVDDLTREITLEAGKGKGGRAKPVASGVASSTWGNIKADH